MSRSKIITFGKHIGKELNEVPLSYIAWLLTKYKGTSLDREDIEQEAIKRGCSKRNGSWGIEVKPKITGGFDVNGFGYGTMTGVIQTYNEDYEQDAECDDDLYDYEGIPNTY